MKSLPTREILAISESEEEVDLLIDCNDEECGMTDRQADHVMMAEFKERIPRKKRFLQVNIYINSIK